MRRGCCILRTPRTWRARGIRRNNAHFELWGSTNRIPSRVETRHSNGRQPLVGGGGIVLPGVVPPSGVLCRDGCWRVHLVHLHLHLRLGGRRPVVLGLAPRAPPGEERPAAGRGIGLLLRLEDACGRLVLRKTGREARAQRGRGLVDVEGWRAHAGCPRRLCVVVGCHGAALATTGIVVFPRERGHGWGYRGKYYGGIRVNDN